LAQDIQPMVKAGIDFGGDTVVTVLFTNGSTQSIKANDGAYIGGGVSYLSDDKTLQGELTLAYKTDSIDASNGSVEFTRYPLEALLFYREQAFRLGGGFTYHLSPRIKGSGIVGNANVDLKDAPGAILQADYRVWRELAVGLRYTILEYKATNGFTGTAKSNGFGITFRASF